MICVGLFNYLISPSILHFIVETLVQWSGLPKVMIPITNIPTLNNKWSSLSRRTRKLSVIPTDGQNDRVTINIAGFQYTARRRTLERYPDTLLGNEEDLSKYYDEVEGEYYFERNR